MRKVQYSRCGELIDFPSVYISLQTLLRKELCTWYYI